MARARQGGKTGPLRLRALDAEDMSIVAACLQDAVMPVREMTFLPDERRFVAVLDRFMWERMAEGGADLHIVRAGLRFEQVESARVSHLDTSDTSAVLELLTVTRDADAVLLLFAGGAAIRLEGARMVCLLEDLSEPRPARCPPHHALDEDEDQ